MSMLPPLTCVGAANRRGAAAKPAPRPKVFLKKSRLFFMALPLQGWPIQLSAKTLDIGSKRDKQPGNRHQVAAGYTAARGKWRNSNAKDGKGRRMCRERSGWAAIQTPYGG